MPSVGNRGVPRLSPRQHPEVQLALPSRGGVEDARKAMWYLDKLIQKPGAVMAARTIYPALVI